MTDAFDKPWSGMGVGGSLALDFANTLDWRLREEPEELFRTFPDVLRWARSAGVLDTAEARALRTWSAAHPRAAARSLARAREVREDLAALFTAAAGGRELPGEPLSRLGLACRSAQAARTLEPRGPAAAWRWTGPAGSDRAAWAAALDASRLLTTDIRRQVRQCADAQCGWFFLDASRNRSRRWCTMKGCGNRNKARRFYRREASRREEPR